MADHIKSFTAGSRTLVVSFEQVPDANASSLPSSELVTMESSRQESGEPNLSKQEIDLNVPLVSFWRWCQQCDTLVTPVTLLTSAFLYKYSLARFLLICFMDQSEYKVWISDQLEYTQCPHTCEQHVMFFSTGRWVLRWDVWRRELLELGGVCNRSIVEQRRFDTDNMTWKMKRIYNSMTEQRQKLELALTELEIEMKSKVRHLCDFIDSLSENEAIRAQCLLEVVCMQKTIHMNQLLFRYRIDSIFCEEEVLSWPLLRRLRKAYNTVKVDMYKSACRQCYAFVQLQRMIKYHISALCTSSSFSSSSLPAKFGVFLQLMQSQAHILRSPLVSPRTRSEKCNVTAASVDELLDESSILPLAQSEHMLHIVDAESDDKERPLMVENTQSTEILYEEFELTTLTPSTVKLEVAATQSIKVRATSFIILLLKVMTTFRPLLAGVYEDWTCIVSLETTKLTKISILIYQACYLMAIQVYYSKTNQLSIYL